MKREQVELTGPHAEAILEEWLNRHVKCHRINPLYGGQCSAVFRLDFDRAPYSAVVKLQENPGDDPLPRERAYLDYLHRNTSVPVPQVYLYDDSGTLIPYSFLLIELLPGMTLESARLEPHQRTIIEFELATVLLELHSHTRNTFGDFNQDPGVFNWADIFLPDLDELRRDMDPLLARDILEALDQVLPLATDAFLNQGQPTLVHNDLWAGNIMVQERIDGWHLSGLLDPGLRYADVEKDLAYLQAFNTVGQPFFDAYTSRQPLRKDYEFRKLFYWLHTFMLHVWLGEGYEYHERIRETCRQVMSASVHGRK